MGRPRLTLSGALLLLLVGCAEPVPRQIELEMELGPQVVRLTGRLQDLMIHGDDALRGFIGFGAIATPAALHDLLTEAGAHRTWLRSVSRYTFQEQDGRVDLLATGEAARADFDDCLTASCPPGAGEDDKRRQARKAACQLFPLRRCGDHYELARDLQQNYAPVAGAATSWPASAQRIALRLRVSPEDSLRPAAQAYRLYAGDADGGLRARAWIRDYARAFVAGDAGRVAELERRIADHPALLRGMLETYRDRSRAILLHQVLLAHDRAYLPDAPEVPAVEARDLDALVPKAPPPRAALWGLRALYEISARVGAAFPSRRDEVCAEPSLRAGNGYGRICQLLGARPPAKDAATGRPEIKPRPTPNG